MATILTVQEDYVHVWHRSEYELWGFRSNVDEDSWILRRVDWELDTDVSAERNASIFRVEQSEKSWVSVCLILQMEAVSACQSTSRNMAAY